MINRRPLADINLAILCRMREQRPGPDHARLPHADAVAQRGVRADKAVRAHMNMPGNSGARGDITVILDGRMMPDETAAPDDNIAAQRDKWLHRRVFKYEAVVAHLLAPVGRARTDIRDQLVTARF